MVTTTKQPINNNLSTTNFKRSRTRTTCAKAVQEIVKRYRVDVKQGRIYNNTTGIEVGNNVYEPRVTIHIPGKETSVKYNTRVSKVVGFVVYGPDALRRNVQVRHKDGNKHNNRGSNLVLKYT